MNKTIDTRISYLLTLYLQTNYINKGRNKPKGYVAKWRVWRALRDAEVAMLTYRHKL
jgi:hypothetical protein